MTDTEKKRLPYRVIQSPMCGCTDLPFRRIARRFGCEFAFTEMVKDRPVLEGNRRTARLPATDDGDRPLGVQIAGSDPQQMAEAAAILEREVGADVIDVNLGCPVRKVVRSGCGAALLGDPDQVGRILESITSAVRIPVTIKMRSGSDGERFLDVARIAERCGAAWVTVHGRTDRQKLSGKADYNAIRAVKESVSIPVVGNGGVKCGTDAARMMKETGCDAVMVARGALGNPWIYREIAAYLETGRRPPPPTAADRTAVLREHFRLMRDFYGDRGAFYRVRRVIHWFIKGARGSRELRERANRIRSEGDFEEIVRTFDGSAPRNP